mmetsp:Transcript_25721/g.66238  ORF Transcript_25721/g.66238 Transcript_25721/m.66238 type:complete len:85 (+) Transcript_25721:2114-2368(+)
MTLCASEGTSNTRLPPAHIPTTHRSFYSLTGGMGTLVTLHPDCELYAVFDPLAEKAHVVQVAKALVSWVKQRYTELFIPLVEKK